ncbi:hypothetical protein IFM89_016770 [Coptis chinensis]|uniref:Aminopeptidase P N-terminal domain-containing protein n=1 Tax=Coptis chinensis TaxID=261450 RepID=A0A835H914_9MAGN|nr:hypothetical protein IFM89_016770 [Coptis chinensis]
MQCLRRKLVQKLYFNQIIGRCSYSTKKINDVGQPTAATHPQLLEEGEITPCITVDEYTFRRKRLLELLPEKSLAIIAAAPVKMMTDVVPYTYRQDSDYLYITGCQQPGGVAVLGHDCGLCMFMPEPDPHDVIWQGQIAGVDAALDTFKADNAFPINKMHKILQDMISSSSKLFHNVKTALPSYMDLEAFQKASSSGKVMDLSIYTHELRWIKSQAEAKLMREAASIACQALLQTMFVSKTSPDEGKLSAKFEFECRMKGAQRMAFNPVVGGGANGSVIHYSRNDQKIKDGDLLLMDVGCELHGYVSDMTRTWPPCGSFSSSQEELYDLILETNKECVKLCKPGASIRQIHNHSVEMLRKGLKEIGILKDERSLSRTYNQLNPTSIGHYLGMDVHDCSMISVDRPLKPGVTLTGFPQVVTIEPGVYIPSFFDCPKWFQGTGIRIEDEVLITETGYEVLTGSVPKEVQHIKSLLNNFSHGGTFWPCLPVREAVARTARSLIFNLFLGRLLVDAAASALDTACGTSCSCTGSFCCSVPTEWLKTVLHCCATYIRIPPRPRPPQTYIRRLHSTIPFLLKQFSLFTVWVLIPGNLEKKTRIVGGCWKTTLAES